MKVADQYCPWGIGCQMPEDLPVWEMETLRFIAEDWRAEVERLGLSAPVDETALQVAQLKLAQCEDALEASRAATKDLQPKGPVRAQLEYARRKRDIDYHSVLLQYRKKEFPFIARNWSLLPDVQAQAEEAIERRHADLDSYLESEYGAPPSQEREYTFWVDMDVFFDWEIEDEFSWDMEDDVSE